MFLSRKIDIKLCPKYAKMNIYTILYKSNRFKQIIFSKYPTNLKTILSQRSLKISGLLILYFFLHVAFLIDIIDNSPYSAYYVTGT